MAKKKKKKKKKKKRCWKNMKRKKKPEKEETLNSSKHFKPRHQSKTKMYYILKIFEVEGVAVEVEEIVTEVEVVIKKGIMRRMGNKANKIRR
jgi:cytochrome c biogenesis protein ResB